MEAKPYPMVEHAPNGGLEFREINGEMMGIAYRCPHCGEEDWLELNQPTGWKWNGSRDKCSLTPSVKHRPCGYHAFLINGEWVKQPDSP